MKCTAYIMWLYSTEWRQLFSLPVQFEVILEILRYRSNPEYKERYHYKAWKIIRADGVVIAQSKEEAK